MADLEVGQKVTFKSFEEIVEIYGIDTYDWLPDVPHGCTEEMADLFKSGREFTIKKVFGDNFYIEDDDYSCTYHTDLILEVPILDLKDIYG